MARFRLSSITKRLREPSTYAALGALGAVFGVRELESLGTPENVTAAVELGSFASLLLGLFLGEKGRE